MSDITIADYLIYHETTGTVLDGDEVQLYSRKEYDTCMNCGQITLITELDDDLNCADC